MGNNMIPTAIAIGEKYAYFLTNHHQIFENIKNEEEILLDSTNDSLDLFDYHHAKCGEDVFEKMACNQIHIYYPDEEVEEEVLDAWKREQETLIKPEFCIGISEMVKIFNSECVICSEWDSGYAFRQRGHQCMCESCYQIEGVKIC